MHLVCSGTIVLDLISQRSFCHWHAGERTHCTCTDLHHLFVSPPSIPLLSAGARHVCTGAASVRHQSCIITHNINGKPCMFPRGQSQYLMYPELTRGPNALRFSPCSLITIQKMIMQRASQCFQRNSTTPEGQLSARTPQDDWANPDVMEVDVGHWRWQERVRSSCTSQCGPGLQVLQTQCQSLSDDVDATGAKCLATSESPTAFFRVADCIGPPCPPCPYLQFSSPLRPEFDGWLSFDTSLASAYQTPVWSHTSIDLTLMRLTGASQAHDTAAWALIKGRGDMGAELVTPAAASLLGFISVAASADSSDISGAWVLRDRQGRGNISPAFFTCQQRQPKPPPRPRIVVRQE